MIDNLNHHAVCYRSNGYCKQIMTSVVCQTSLLYLPCSSQALSSVVVEAMEGSLESLGAGTGRVAVDIVVAAGGGGGATSLSGEAKLTAVRDSSGVPSGFLVRI